MGRIALKQAGIPNHKLQKNLDVNGFVINDGLAGEGLYLKDWDGNPQMRAGLNISNPAHTLTVYDADYPYIQFINSHTGSGQNDGLVIGMQKNAAAYITLRESSPLIFRTSDTDRLTIEKGGNVGIGVADPDTTLEVWSASTQLKLSNSDTSYATIGVISGSRLSIATAESGNITIDTAGGNIALKSGGGTYTPTADSDAATKKYVDDKVPDTSKFYYDIRIANYYATATANYLPLAGYVTEKTSTTNNNEYLAMIAPFDGTLEEVVWRSEMSQNGATSLRILEASDETEIPGTTIYRKDYTLGLTQANTVVTVDMSSPSVGTDPPTFTKGKLYVVYLRHPNAPYDTNVTLTFKWDVTS